MWPDSTKCQHFGQSLDKNWTNFVHFLCFWAHHILAAVNDQNWIKHFVTLDLQIGKLEHTYDLFQNTQGTHTVRGSLNIQLTSYLTGLEWTGIEVLTAFFHQRIVKKSNTCYGCHQSTKSVILNGRNSWSKIGRWREMRGKMMWPKLKCLAEQRNSCY